MEKKPLDLSSVSEVVSKWPKWKQELLGVYPKNINKEKEEKEHDKEKHWIDFLDLS